MWERKLFFEKDDEEILEKYFGRIVSDPWKTWCLPLKHVRVDISELIFKTIWLKWRI